MENSHGKPKAGAPPLVPGATAPPDLGAASIPDALKSLNVNPDIGLTPAEVDARRKSFGYNEVADRKQHPIRKFLGKFWGISAWMLELIMVLSAVLGKFSDLAVVGALLVINAILSFSQEHRAAGAAVPPTCPSLYRCRLSFLLMGMHWTRINVAQRRHGSRVLRN